MRWVLSLGGCVASVVAVGACGTDSSGGSAETMRIEARQAVLVTNEPLSDVVWGELEAGDAATALCFVPEAQTNTGAAGSAVKIESGRLSGYAAVTTLQAGTADREPVFDVSEGDLRNGLPSCRP
jgi:hypothetical protein